LRCKERQRERQAVETYQFQSVCAHRSVSCSSIATLTALRGFSL
jgi:hypothetical protein